MIGGVFLSSDSVDVGVKMKNNGAGEDSNPSWITAVGSGSNNGEFLRRPHDHADGLPPLTWGQGHVLEESNGGEMLTAMTPSAFLWTGGCFFRGGTPPPTLLTDAYTLISHHLIHFYVSY